jgi:predicted MPP superfamily phosphohydrolase
MMDHGVRAQQGQRAARVKTPEQCRRGWRRSLDSLMRSVAPALRRCGVRYRLFQRHTRIEFPQVRVCVPRLPRTFDGFRIALLSDLHYSVWCEPSDYDRLVELVNAVGPDLVVLTGDNVSFHGSLIEPAVRMLGRLRARHGTYAVLGNHDYWIGAGAMVRACEARGIRLLLNEWEGISVDGHTLVLAGVDDLVAGEPDVAAALRAMPDGAPVILLSHVPSVVNHPLVERADLVLSGHTHGGQVSFPFVGPLFLPKHATRRLLHGLHDTPRTRLYISRGVGAAGLWFRWRVQPEVPIIVLRAP